MKTTLSLRRCLILLLVLIAGSIASPAPARADLIDDFAWILDKVPGVFPVSGQDIKDSRALLEDLGNLNPNNSDFDLQVANLLEKHKNTKLGQQAASGAPSWFWDLIDTYIAFRTNDFWGVVGHLGKGAICIVAQIMAGGLDACGLIEELIELAETFADAATAVAEFVASVGKGIAGVAEDIWCGITGCDDDGGSPPEQIAYAWVFQPMIPAGVTAREAVDPLAFDALRAQLEADAKAKPSAKLHYPGLPSMPGLTFGDEAVKIASGAYTKAVDLAWRQDVVGNALPELLKKRYAYNTPQQVAAVAAKAATQYINDKKDPKTPPYTVVQNLCANDFSKAFGYAHVDRWIALYPGEAKTAGDAKSSKDWCLATFWGKNKEEFAKQFLGYAKANLCPQFGQTLLCNTVSRYESCLGIMGSVGQKDQCTVNIATAGKEAAEKVYASLKTQGLKIPCQIVADTAPISGKPARLLCTRPTQRHACDETYKTMYGDLPKKLVECAGDDLEPYKTLRAKVAGAVASLNQQYPNPSGGIPFGVDLIDPLIVHAPTVDLAAAVQQQNPNFGFGPPSSKPGFDYLKALIGFPRTIDGMTTPTLGKEIKLPNTKQAQQLDPVSAKIRLVKPSDPDPTLNPALKSPLTVQAKPSAVAGAAPLKTSAPMKTMSGAAPPGSGPGAGTTGSAPATKGASLQAKAAPGAAPAPQNPLGAGTPAPAPTSGPAPAPGGGRTAASAEIRSGPRVTVAGKYPVAWGQEITLSEADVRRAQNGICDVAFGHDTINTGTAATGPFSRRWANPQNPAPFTDTYPSIPAGGSLQRTDTLPLKPGINRLTLGLDHLNQVKETNEGDNIYHVTVTVRGNCGLPAGAPGTGGVQTAPRSLLPAVPQTPASSDQRRLNPPR